MDVFGCILMCTCVCVSLSSLDLRIFGVIACLSMITSLLLLLRDKKSTELWDQWPEDIHAFHTFTESPHKVVNKLVKSNLPSQSLLAWLCHLQTM